MHDASHLIVSCHSSLPLQQQQCYGEFVPCRPSPTHGAEMIGSEVHGRRRGQTEIKGATLPCIRMRELKVNVKCLCCSVEHV